MAPVRLKVLFWSQKEFSLIRIISPHLVFSQVSWRQDDVSLFPGVRQDESSLHRESALATFVLSHLVITLPIGLATCLAHESELEACHFEEEVPFCQYGL